MYRLVKVYDNDTGVAACLLPRIGLARRATGRFPTGRRAGRLVDRLAGGQQKYYEVLFFLAIDVINCNKKYDCLSKVVMSKRLRQKTVKIILWYSILFKMWSLAITSLYKQSRFYHNICGFSDERWIKYNFDPNELFCFMIISLSWKIFIGN